MNVSFKLKQNGISGNLLNLLYDFLRNGKQRVLLNEQVSCPDVKVGFPKSSVPGLLLLLIYINDLTVGLSSNSKLFADDTSLFSAIHNNNTSALKLNNDLANISRWGFQLKMSFNLDTKKQAHEGSLSRKSKVISHPY